MPEPQSKKNTMIYIANAFSLQMAFGFNFVVESIELSSLGARVRLKGNEFTSAIGHEDTARVVSQQLGMEIPAKRTNIKLSQNDTLVVAQFIGERLPEGATTLPEGIKLQFAEITISYPSLERPCTCGSGEPWDTCEGLDDGDHRYCG
jgi:hypothetical protein